MCVTCGCGSEAKTTVLNLQTGMKTALGDDHGHDHEPVAANSAHVGHTHAHGDHTHDHEHGHDHTHDHAHDEAHGHDHDHVHANGSHHVHHHGHDHGHDHEHTHADGTRHAHPPHEGHAASHAHAESHAHGTVIDLETRILAKNDARAARNRAWLAGREILAVNLMSGPGAGKTTLLERTIRDLATARKLFVIEGDQATANDAARVQAAGALVVQVNTGTGCHLDADMIAHGLGELKPPLGALVIIENVGNLVCPALFDLGEAAKIAILSVTEGDDKPAKYPHMFAAANLVLISKIDLLPHVDFSVEKAAAFVREVNPGVTVLTVSAKTGEGMDGWYAWLAAEQKGAGATMGL